VVINEALAHTDPPQVDAIELYNSSFSHADLSGWFLTDDFGDPKKYRIPDGTRLPPGGFMVFTEEHFNQGENSFALSSLGEEVYLFSGGRDGNLSGYFHGFAFEASENGVSFGRHLSSAGEEHFVAQNRLTLGAPNAGPLVGPVVLNELMFYPPRFNGENNTIDEYLELHNVTDQPVQLFDPEAPENTWQLMAGVRFEFPSGLVIPPRGFLLVAGFDPQNEPEQLARFRQLFQVDADVPILGPFTGNLNNAGERVALYKPDGVQGEHHENAGYVPYVLVDQVEYGNSAPWPEGANGTGHSLQRFLSSSYGNDPLNWDAAPPTAGGPNLGSAGMDTDGDGLPDAWELLHGLDPRDPTGDQGAAGDPDGDGRNNLEEFLSGTDPRDPLSHLRIDSVGLAPGPDRSVQIRFRAMASIGYQLLHRDRLEDSWRALADIPPEGETRELEILDSPANSERFYQLRIQTDP
jgi:hypothetical protein